MRTDPQEATVRRAKKDAKTFIATIRIDIRHLASVAMFLNSKGIHMETKGKLASEAIRLMGGFLSTDFPVHKYEDAVKILYELRYGDVLEKGTSYYRALLGQTIREEDANRNLTEYTKLHQPTADMLVAEHRARQAANQPSAEENIKRMEDAPNSPIAEDTELKPAEPAESVEHLIAPASPGHTKDIDKRSTDDVKNMRKGLGIVAEVSETDE